MRLTDSDYVIPKGYEVHHIVPISEAKRLGWSKEKIHHPDNLMVVSKEEHLRIHIERGDKIAKDFFLSLKDYVPTDEHRKNISTRLTNRKLSSQHIKNRTISQTDHSLYLFTHDSSLQFISTRHDAQKAFNTSYSKICNMINKSYVYRGWSCVKSQESAATDLFSDDMLQRIKNANRNCKVRTGVKDENMYLFTHDEIGSFVSTREYFSYVSKLSGTSIIRIIKADGKYKAKGWKAEKFILHLSQTIFSNCSRL